MTYNLDFALLYAYALTLFAFIALWLLPQVLRALLESAERWVNRPREDATDAGERPSAVPPSRLEAFTRL